MISICKIHSKKHSNNNIFMPAKITEQAILNCDKGSATGLLTVTSQRFCKAGNRLIATENDKEAGANIPMFGICSITKKNCAPEIKTWIDTSAKDTISELRILTEKSFCLCSRGGKILIQDKGHTEIHEVQ